jgi:Ca-activated chloride channel family protein
MGNYQDARLEQLADKGDGNYGYVDNLGEARKMLVRELTGTLFTVARDVKLQVEFNPARVKAYRLLGYENRLLNPEDFLDDSVDGGEMGAGHSVTALYEVVPVGAASPLPQVEPLKYQPRGEKKTLKDKGELLTVKARWQSAGRFAAGERRLSLTADKIPPCGQASEDFRFAAAVAEFARLLNRHQDTGTANWEEIVSLARNSRGDDPHGDRGEFLRLVETAQSLWELEVRRDD